MIYVYKPTNCADCANIEETLKELVVAHKIITLQPGQQTDALTPDTPLPAIKDQGEIITGKAEIAVYLLKLEKIVADWRRFQSDACYVDEDSGIC